MTVSGLNPSRPKRFTFRHDGRKLVGFLLARGDEAEPYTVRLQSWGTIAGRLVDAQGQPRAGVEVTLFGHDFQDLEDEDAGPVFIPGPLKPQAVMPVLDQSIVVSPPSTAEVDRAADVDLAIDRTTDLIDPGRGRIPGGHTGLLTAQAVKSGGRITSPAVARQMISGKPDRWPVIALGSKLKMANGNSGHVLIVL